MGEEEQEKSIQDYIVAIRKRKAAVISVFSAVLLLAVLIALLLPSIYKSSSTILIEQQEIPSQLVMSTVTSYASERIQIIQARVMTRTNLMKIVDKYGLYEDERKYATTEDIVTHMRDDISLDLINAGVVDPKTGKPSTATIAFSLSFKGKSATKAQRVANELTTLYLNENITSRSQKAEETSEFFKEEAGRLTKKINELESKLADFKQEHTGALPELQSLNLNVLQRKETELASIDTTLRTLDEKRFYLGAQLDQVDPGNPDIPGSVERLKALKAEYASVRSKYSDEHPDVVRLKNEIASLEKETGESNNTDAIAEQLSLLNNELAQKKQRYTADHPDIIGLQEKISSLNSELRKIIDSPLSEHYEAKPDNPLYITLQTQLAGIDSEIKSYKTRQEEVLKQISELEQMLYTAPQLEREYLVLQRDYQNAVNRYQQTKSKQMYADIAKQLESESKGEKFTLIEPAVLPEKPISPNRPAIMIIGFILAIGTGLGYAIVADMIGGAVRGARSIRRVLGVSPLSVIPYEMNLQDRVKIKRIKKRIILLIIIAIIAAFLFVHFVISPIDVLWFRILRKIDILMS